MTLIGRPVSLASCSRICRVGFGVAENADLSTSSCLALMVVLGPRRFDPELPSSGDLFSFWQSRASESPSREPEGRDREVRDGVETSDVRRSANGEVKIS